MTQKIELLGFECDLDPEVREAAKTLNAAQSEFLFEPSSSPLHHPEMRRPLECNDHLSSGIFRSLKNYRKATDGHHRYIVAFINTPLQSRRLGNLFASIRARTGLAIVTRYDAELFAPSIRSYFAYYLARCALGFVAPDLRNHEDTRSCYFDLKINKYDLRRSLAAGDLCDECRTRFDSHTTTDTQAAFNAIALAVARLGFGATAAAIASRVDYASRLDKPSMDEVQHSTLARGTRRRLFISYSQADEPACERLEAHLKVLHRNNMLETWNARRIPVGEDWSNEISTYLYEADIIVLLVSADFMASDYCWEVEMMRALRRHEEGSAIVVPVILKSCLWQEAPFAKLKPVPKNGHPVVRWTDPDDAWLDVTQEIQRLITT